MTDETKLPKPKIVKANFVGEKDLPIHYVNFVNVRSGQEEFFITLGTATPPDITDIKDLDEIDNINVLSLFRFAVSRSVMKQIIEVMQTVYDQQTKQLEMLQRIQEETRENE